MAPRALVAVLLCAYTASAFVAAPKARVGALKLSAAKTDFSVAPLAGAAALAALAAPQVAYAEVGLGGEVAGVFLGILPLAAIVRFPASRFVRARGRPRRPAAAAARSFARGRWGSTVGINSRDPTTGTRMRLRLKPFLLPFSTEKKIRRRSSAVSSSAKSAAPSTRRTTGSGTSPSSTRRRSASPRRITYKRRPPCRVDREPPVRSFSPFRLGVTGGQRRPGGGGRS